jgi:RNA polymerase sigma-70 factor (ECF subfamily)
MSEPSTSPTAANLERLRAGDPDARNALLSHTRERLQRLARRMLRGYHDIGRWEDTDDVLQNALVRLSRALDAAAPTSVRHFYRLAAVQIRRELEDLADRYRGPCGVGANHQTDQHGAALAGAAAPSEEPASAEVWSEFHRQVEALPDDEQEVVALLWYGGLSQEAAAQTVGVSVRTIKRRWLSARLVLARALGGSAPPA